MSYLSFKTNLSDINKYNLYLEINNNIKEIILIEIKVNNTLLKIKVVLLKPMSSTSVNNTNILT